jgi:hypothetical protein
MKLSRDYTIICCAYLTVKVADACPTEISLLPNAQQQKAGDFIFRDRLWPGDLQTDNFQ